MEYIRSVFGSIIGEGGISLYAALTLDVFDDLINRLVGVALELALIEEEAELAARARRVATHTLKILGIGELAGTIASRCSLIAHSIDARRILKTDLIETRVVKVLDLNLDRRALGLAFCGLGALLVLIAVELVAAGTLARGVLDILHDGPRQSVKKLLRRHLKRFGELHDGPLSV